MGHVAAEVKHRQIEQPFALQNQEVQDAAGAIIERMDALELVMRDRHSQDRVEIIVGMDAFDQVGQQRLHLGGFLRRKSRFFNTSGDCGGGLRKGRGSSFLCPFEFDTTTWTELPEERWQAHRGVVTATPPDMLSPLKVLRAP